MDVYDLWLDGVSGISAAEKGRLAKRYGGGIGVYEAGAEQICKDATGLTPSRHPEGERWLTAFKGDLSSAERVWESMERKGIQCVSLVEEAFPLLLKELDCAPWLLYYKGSLACLRRQGVAVVGARRSTEYGRWAAYELGRRLAEAGAVVISGMAYGADAAAHKGALAAGREDNQVTAAVLGCGVDICYPKVNGELMEKIIQQGVVLSELPPGTEPRPYFFPRRNRIISGLSLAVVVTEAGLQSGSLITAELAAEQGKDVYAVPGNINRVASIGTNKLIKDGATPVVVISELLLELGLSAAGEEKILQAKLGNDEKRIYDEIFSNGERTADQLARALGFSVSRINAIVTVLEMKGILQTALGKIFIAKL